MRGELVVDGLGHVVVAAVDQVRPDDHFLDEEYTYEDQETVGFVRERLKNWFCAVFNRSSSSLV